MTKSMRNKDVNLLLSYRRKPKNLETKKSSGMKYLFPLLLVAIGVYGFMHYYNKIDELEKEVQKNKSYVNSSYNEEIYDKSEQLLNEMSQMSSINAQLQTEIFLATANTNIDLKKIKTIYSCLNENVYIESMYYTNDSDSIALKMVCTNQFEVNACAKRLKQTGIFSNVGYSGYELSIEENEYTFTVVCEFNGK